MSKNMFRLVLFASVLLVGGGAYAAATEWGGYRVDLIRCQDAANFCGSAVTGTDPLSSGRITVDEAVTAVRIRGAKPETAYRVLFIQLKNNGTNVSGPYGAAASRNIGEFTTDRKGNASVKFNAKSTTDPRSGFYYIGHPGLTNEFTTGIDQL